MGNKLPAEGHGPLIRAFGKHVKSLRRVRGMTQDALAESSGLAVDTIRRLEHGSFAPSLETLRKVAQGFAVSLSTMFEAFEVGQRDGGRELLDLVHGRSARQIELATSVLRLLFAELDALAEDATESEDDDEP